MLVDQEGGRVQRFGPPHWPVYPPGAVYARLYDRDRDRGLRAAWLGARLIASDLLPMGVNVDCLPLVRPLVSLDGGRLILLESPLRPALLAGCARTLLAEAAPGQRGWWAAAAADGPTIDRRDYRIGGCWVGVLDCGGSAGWSQRPLPWLFSAQETETGTVLAAMLTLADSSGEPAPEPLSALELRGLGDRPQWLFPTPAPGTAPGGAVALFSALRLPAWTEIGQAGTGAPVCLAAAAGDLVVAVAPGLGWLDRIRGQAAVGGPALLDALEAELQRAPSAFSCVAVELS